MLMASERVIIPSGVTELVAAIHEIPHRAHINAALSPRGSGPSGQGRPGMIVRPGPDHASRSATAPPVGSARAKP